MANLIELDDSLIIGKGSERVCYQHPNDSNLCIKIRYRIKRSRDESEREFEYAQRFVKQGLKVPLALPVEWVETNLGRGLVFPLIRDDNGEISSALDRVEDKQLLEQVFTEFAQILLTNTISVTDLRIQNLVLQRTKTGPRVVMVDGYGYTNDFLKNLYRITKFVTFQQTKRRLERFTRDYILRNKRQAN